MGLGSWEGTGQWMSGTGQSGAFRFRIVNMQPEEGVFTSEATNLDTQNTTKNRFVIEGDTREVTGIPHISGGKAKVTIECSAIPDGTFVSITRYTGWAIDIGIQLEYENRMYLSSTSVHTIISARAAGTDGVFAPWQSSMGKTLK